MSAECRAYFKDSCPPCLSERTGGGRCDDDGEGQDDDG